jgi:hypothetical protein
MRRGLLLTTALLLTACGGGEDAKAAYVKDAAAICDDAATESEALKAPKTPAEFSPYADSIVRIAKQAQEDLSALEPPEDDRAELESKVLKPFAAVVEEGEAFAAKVKAAGQDQAKLLPLLGQVPDAGDVDLEYLRDYGLDTCADVISRK